MGPRSGPPGTSVTRLWSPSRRRPGKHRQQSEDSYYRTSVATLTWSSSWAAAGRLACTHLGTGGGRCAEDTANGRSELEESLALYQQCLQQVLGLTRAEAHAEQRRQRLKVVGLLPVAGRTLGAAEAGYEGKDEDEDKGVEVPSRVRWCLTFTPQEEREQERQLAWAWQDLESQATAILPKTVRARALELLRWLMDGGYISWRPDTLELIVDDIEHKGTNLVDLAGHVLKQHLAEPLVHGSPGLPHCFAKFAAALRCANASYEQASFVRNRCCWPQIYSASDNDDNGGDDTEAEEPSDDEEEELWEEEATESVCNEPSAMTEDDSDREEDYAMPSHSNKQDQNPFAHWESNN